MSKVCTHCGTPVEGDKHFCTECGASIDTEPQPIPEPQTAPQPVYTPQQQTYAPQAAEYVPGSDSKYEPISTGGYIGIMFLMCIPVIGFILMLVWAFGGCRKINKRNLARAYLILSIIGVVLTVALSVFVANFLANEWGGLYIP